MQGEVGEKGRFIYFDTEYHPGTVIEPVSYTHLDVYKRQRAA